jgi:hypothetical protein
MIARWRKDGGRARGRDASRSAARRTRAFVTSIVWGTLISLACFVTPAPARAQSSTEPEPPRIASPLAPKIVEQTTDEAREQIRINEDCAGLARRFVWLVEEYDATEDAKRAAVAEAAENAASRDEWKGIAANREALIREARHETERANKRARANLVKGGVWGFVLGLGAAAALVLF